MTIFAELQKLSQDLRCDFKIWHNGERFCNSFVFAGVLNVATRNWKYESKS